MRKYDLQEITFLQAEQSVEDVHGQPVLVKGIPEEKRSGYIDPHELACMTPSGQQKAAPPPQTPQEKIQAVRDSMGFPNLNLNTIELYTGYEVLDIQGNTVGLWRYYPRKTRNVKNKPCLIYIHGGGWMGGTPFAVENPCRLIAELADAVVFNVDYSLAPEKKYPNGLNDCFGVLKHVYENAETYGIDPKRIAVGGDSAGGNLTATVSMMDRDLGQHMVALQVLIYPCVTFLSTGIPGYQFDISEFEMSEEQQHIIDKMVSIGRPKSDMDDSVQMDDMYITNKSAAYHPYVSPMLSLDHHGLPPALCISAEFDGLRLQTEHYAKLLNNAGVPAKAIRYKGVAHAFIDRLGFVPQAEDLCIEIAKAMKAI